MTRHRNFAVALAVLWLGFTAWLRPLTVPDEGRYASVAWEMLRSGDWLVPSLNGLPFFHKPPLFYWITAGSLGLFGMNEWAARAASLCGALLAAISICLLARRWAGVAAARWTALALLAQPLFFMASQYANLDLLLAGCVTATLSLLIHCVLSLREGGHPRAALVAAYGFAALGVLAKGLIGFVLPALVLGLWLLSTLQWRLVVRLLSVPGLLLFAALTLPWFTAMQARYPGFLHYFFVVQHFQRFVEHDFNNARPFWFFPAVLLLLGLPWSLWLAARARASWLSRGWWTAPGPHGMLRQAMAFWLLAVVGFFSFPQSKLVGYVLPAAPPFAFLVASLIAPMLPQPRWRRWALLCAALGAIACVTAAVVAGTTNSRSLRDMGRTLGALRQPHDTTVYMKNFYYDLAFYARLDGPVLVVDDWHDPALTGRDNWRRELLDARQFAKGGTGEVLLTRGQLEQRICAGMMRRIWLVGPRSWTEDDSMVAGGREIAHSGNTVLWQLAPVVPCARAQR